MNQSLTPKEMARVIGVSESTLKRWADGGRLRVMRTVGGHRRISRAEAVRFVRETKLPVRYPELLGLGDLKIDPASDLTTLIADADALFSDYLERGDADAARSLLLRLYMDGRSLAWLFDGPMRAALAHLGTLWHDEAIGIAVEHRGTDICETLIRRLRDLSLEVGHTPTPDTAARAVAGDPDDVPLAMGCTPPGDAHAVGSLMTACVAGEVGYRAINLGANLPLEVLGEMGEKLRPRLVWLSCCYPPARPDAQTLAALAQRVGTWDGRLVVGGGGLGGGPGQNEGADVGLSYCASLTEFADLAGRLRAA